MLMCKVCFIRLTDCNEIFLHLKYSHPSLDNFKCFVSDCDRSYSNISCLKRHVDRAHKDIKVSLNKTEIIDKSNGKGLDNDTQLEDNLISTEYNNILQKENNLLASFNECYSSDESDFSDYLEDELNQSINVQSESEKVISDLASDFIAKLYNFSNVSRKTVTQIVCDTSQLFDKLLCNLKTEITHCLQNVEPNCKIEVNNIFETYSRPLKTIETEQKCLNYFRNCDTYIPPESIVIGERREYKKKNEEQSLQHIPVNIQFIALRKVLKEFFELPGVLDDTIEYLNYLTKNSNVIVNIVQGSFLKNTVFVTPEKITMPIIKYFDDYENNNPLGSHKGISKCGAGYTSIPCLPPVYQAKVENIFLFLLFNTLDRQIYSNQLVFDRAIEELNFLYTEGIVVDHHTGPKRLHFSISNIVADNLGIHSILGFNESFRSNLFCHFCLTKYSDINTKFYEKDCQLRDIDNYAALAQENNPKISGIKEDCVFHNLIGFHVANNICVDIMHDLYEGVFRYDLALILHQYIYIYK